LRHALALVRRNGYDGWLTLEWEKLWHPEIEEPEVVFPHFVKSIGDLLASLKMKRKAAVVRTLKQARTYVLQVGICGIFSDAGFGMPNLWEVVDLPERQPGEKGWDQKGIAIWRWKTELPATYPEEMIYGKIPGGRAVLMSMDYLRGTLSETSSTVEGMQCLSAKNI
jgi:hypothetical protein